MTRIFATAMVAVGLSVLAPRLADAEVPEVKLVLQNGSNYLPLMVMQAQNLVEKHLAAQGSCRHDRHLGEARRSVGYHRFILGGCRAFLRSGRAVNRVDLGSHAQRHWGQGDFGDGCLQHLADDA